MLTEKCKMKDIEFVFRSCFASIFQQLASICTFHDSLTSITLTYYVQMYELLKNLLANGYLSINKYEGAY